MGETVLLTGGAGYIGAHTAYALVDAGHDVIILDNLSTSSGDSVPKHAKLVVGEVDNRELVGDLISNHRIHSVIHLAAKTSASESVTFPEQYHCNNVIKSDRLISCCIAFGIRNFVFSSSAAVYGNPTVVPVDEMQPHAAINPYGESKVATELALARESGAGRIQSIVFRHFNVAGADLAGRAGQPAKEAPQIVNAAIDAALGRCASFSIFGEDYDTADGTCIRDFVHVNDVAQAHVLGLEYLLAGGDSVVLNCGGGHGYSVREVLDVVEKLSGYPLTRRSGPRRAGDPASVVAAISRIQETLGWAPRFSGIESIVKSALAWEQCRRVDD